MDSKRAVVLITGASKGIGKEIAIQVGSKISPNSTIIIVARNVDGLNETKQAIRKINNELSVEIYVADFSSKDTKYANEIANLVAKNSKNAEIIGIFHNAGTVGNVSLCSDELNSSDDWHDYLQTNLVSTILLNNAIYSAVKEAELLIVDVTSLLAITAFPSFTQYSVAKASREAFFRSFALEHPKTRILSYSPGPVNTDMRSEVANKSYDEGIRTVFKDTSDASREALTPTQTVSHLMEIIHENKFKSGSRIDYFDN